jgi:hypothetical protein
LNPHWNTCRDNMQRECMGPLGIKHLPLYFLPLFYSGRWNWDQLVWSLLSFVNQYAGLDLLGGTSFVDQFW